MEASPLWRGFGVFCREPCHQSKSYALLDGGLQVMRSQESTSCQICREKEYSKMRWLIVSGSLIAEWAPGMTLKPSVRDHVSGLGKPTSERI